MAAFVALACVMVPAAFMAGGVDRISRGTSSVGMQQSVGEALREATSHRGYLVMAAAFFVCGLQLVFLTTHLPTYLDLCGIEPGVTATALALIGLFNALGSILFGWLGDRLPRHLLLGDLCCSLAADHRVFPVSAHPHLHAALCRRDGGDLAGRGAAHEWTGHSSVRDPLCGNADRRRISQSSGGLLPRRLGRGLIYSTLGSYEWAWRIAVIIGLTAGIAQMLMNTRPVPRVLQERAAAPIPVG